MEIDSITCPLCDDYAESTRHLFFSCKVHCDVMRKITRWWELEYRDSKSYEEWLEWLISIRLSPNLKKVFEGYSLIMVEFDLIGVTVYSPAIMATDNFEYVYVYGGQKDTSGMVFDFDRYMQWACYYKANVIGIHDFFWEVSRRMDLIVKSLYSNKEAFLQELIRQVLGGRLNNKSQIYG
ncbi:hypothetical protein Tco_0633741 [Tanacetum coccineum]